MSAKRYHAPWGRRVKLITAAVGLLGAGTAIALHVFLPVDRPQDRWALWVTPAIVVMIIAITALWMIRGFEITDESVLVRRVFWSNVIPLADIQSVAADDRACEGAWKTTGNDGLFAMHGRFRSKRLGRFQAYVTDAANAVVLRLGGDTIVLSPENPRQFVQELNRRCERRKEQH